MSATALLFGVSATWTAIGIASAMVMGRRGYAPFSWLILGAVLGPLVVPLALSRHGEVRGLTTPLAGTWEGPVDVLVGIDGSRESRAAANVVAHMVGERIGRLTLATVVDYDAALGGEASSTHRAAQAEVEQAAAAIAASLACVPETVVLAGRPADALTARAVEGRFDLLAIGSRGRGASKVVMGSVATQLARATAIPVLIVSAQADPRAVHA